MSSKEIAGRCREQWNGFQERLLVTRGCDPASSLSAQFEGERVTELFSKFRRRPFYYSIDDSDHDAQVAIFQNLFPGHVKNIMQQANEICRGELRLFSRTATFPPENIDWHLDWQTGNHFPLGFYRTMKSWNRREPADSKRVCETNRHQYFVTLGKAYWLTGRSQYADAAVRMIESWIASNPPYTGINWQESLELALRLLSWVWSLRLIENSEALGEASLRRILTSVALQRDHIARHLSHYYSPNTHLLGEALGLFVLGCSFPGVGNSNADAAGALRILENELPRQVADDGSDREQSSYYHCYALDMYLLATLLAQQHRVKLSQPWMHRLERMAEFLAAIIQPDGSLARFGDDDGGRTLRLNDEDYYRPRSLLAVAAVVFGRGDFKHAAGELPEELFWMCGEEGVRRFLNLTSTEPLSKQKWFPNARVAVVRSGFGTRDAWLACLGQPMGFIGSGHSHVAFASFELTLDGKAVIVDPGTYTYEISNTLRDHFRRFEMHNGVQIDGRSYFVPDGPFHWKKTETVEALPLGQEPAGSFRVGFRVSGAETGSIQHIRSLDLASPRSASIRDEFSGTGRHRLAFWLHFARGSRLLRQNHDQVEVQIDETAFELALVGFDNFKLRSWEGTEDPSFGWSSPRFGIKVSSLTLCLEEEANLPAERSFTIRMIKRNDISDGESEVTKEKSVETSA